MIKMIKITETDSKNSVLMGLPHMLATTNLPLLKAI
jgi:hypothetical protein